MVKLNVQTEILRNVTLSAQYMMIGRHLLKVVLTINDAEVYSSYT